MVSFCVKESLGTKNVSVFLKCTIVSDIYEHVFNGLWLFVKGLGGLSESVKKGKIFQIMLNQVQKNCKKLYLLM